jgi:hypothetical protein
VAIAEIGFAVIATSLAIGAVFVPVAFMRGMVGRFFFEFGLTVTFAVAVSTFLAVTLSPMLCSRLLTGDDRARPRLPRLERMFADGDLVRRHAAARLAPSVGRHRRRAGGVRRRHDDRRVAGQRVHAGPGRGPIQHPGGNADRLVARSHRHRLAEIERRVHQLARRAGTFTTIGAGWKAA